MNIIRVKKYKLYILGFALLMVLAYIAQSQLFIKKVSGVKALSGNILVHLANSDTFLIVNLISVPFYIIGFRGNILISLASFSVFLFFCYYQAKNIQNNMISKNKLLIQLLPLIIPSMAYFSLVALRDSVLSVFFCILIITFTKVFIIEERRLTFSSYFKLLLLTFCVLSLRPELMIYLFALGGFAIFLKSKNQLIFLFVGFPIIGWISYFVVDFTLSYNFNLDTAAIGDLYGKVTEVRFLRQLKSDGGNSAIFSLNEFYTLNAGELFLRQMLAVLMVPGIPFPSISLQNLFAILDSMILIFFLTYMFYSTLKKPYKYRIFLVFSIIAYILFITPFAVNYGNIFRMRLPLMYIIYAYVFLDAYVRSVRNVEKTLN